MQRSGYAVILMPVLFLGCAFADPPARRSWESGSKPPASVSHIYNDADGIAAPDDKCPDTLPGVAVSRDDGCAYSDHLPMLAAAQFDVDKSLLAPDAMLVLDTWVEALKSTRLTKAVVVGYADSTEPAFHRGLSKRRARTVHDYLIVQGVDPARLHEPVGYGEASPAKSNINSEDDAQARARNRRAELHRLD